MKICMVSSKNCIRVPKTSGFYIDHILVGYQTFTPNKRFTKSLPILVFQALRCPIRRMTDRLTTPVTRGGNGTVRAAGDSMTDEPTIGNCCTVHFTRIKTTYTLHMSLVSEDAGLDNTKLFWSNLILKYFMIKNIFLKAQEIIVIVEVTKFTQFITSYFFFVKSVLLKQLTVWAIK